MKTRMYSVFDTKMAVFGTPFFQMREPVALRSFKDLVNDPNTTVNKNPEDFSLYFLGEFDDETGSVDLVKPVNICTASSLLTGKLDVADLFSKKVTA